MSLDKMCNSEDGWTTVTKRRKENPNKNKPKKFVRSWTSDITDWDITLTQKENDIIEKEKETNPELNIFCICCQNSLVSDIICRSVFSCGKCYCCSRDEVGCEENYFVNRCGTFKEYNKKYYYKNDNDFYNNY